MDVRQWLVRLVLALALCAAAPAALAHAALTAARPADGGVLAALPRHATLTFDEPVVPLVFSLISPDGTSAPLTRAEAAGNAVRIELPSGHMPGTYALSWRVISADGHPVGGAVVFAVGTATAGAAALAAGAAAQTRAPYLYEAIWFWRLALYVGLFIGVGGALFRAWGSHESGSVPGAGPLGRLALWLGAIAILPNLGLEGLDALNLPWQGLAGAPAWRAAVHTTYAYTLGVAILALIAARCSQAATARLPMRLAATTGLLLLGIAFAASGHASGSPSAWLARPAVTLHVMAVAIWLGALIPLWPLARAGKACEARTLQTFSDRIPWIVAILVATGVTLACLQVDRLSSLWRSSYGQVLLVKLCLVIGLFLLAAWNRYRLTSRIVQDHDRSARRVLARIIVVELILAVAVLATVSLWRFTPPPRNHPVTAVLPTAAVLQTPEATARLLLVPADGEHPGSLLLKLTNAAGGPLEPKAVIVALSNPGLGLEPIVRDASRSAAGTWQIAPFPMPAAARWTVQVDIMMTDFDRVRLQGTLGK